MRDVPTWLARTELRSVRPPPELLLLLLPHADKANGRLPPSTTPPAPQASYVAGCVCGLGAWAGALFLATLAQRIEAAYLAGSASAATNLVRVLTCCHTTGLASASLLFSYVDHLLTSLKVRGEGGRGPLCRLLLRCEGLHWGHPPIGSLLYNSRGWDGGWAAVPLLSRPADPIPSYLCCLRAA